MNLSNSMENIADKTLSGGSILVKLLGVVDPKAATVGIVADLVQKRRSQKFIKRLEKLIHSLDMRVRRLEDNFQLEPDVDLLDEVIAQAISDEDEEKIEYYAALIEYYSSCSIRPQQVRLLSSAFKALLVSEIRGFADFARERRSFRENVPSDMAPIFWNRVSFLGLSISSGGTGHPSKISQILRKNKFEMPKF